MAEKKEEEKEEKSEKEYTLKDLPGIGPSSIEKLEAAGIYDLMGIAVMTPPALSETAGLGEAVARKAIQAARKMMKLDFQTGIEFAKKREEVNCITTGSKNLDALLGGKGVETKAMTEAFGAYGSGKCVSKDTPMIYLENKEPRIEVSESVYTKYKSIYGEKKFDNGFIVPIENILVLGFIKDKFKITKAEYLYREFVKKIFEIKTKRGRLLRICAPHKLLSFDNGFVWKPAFSLLAGDVIAYPKKLNLPCSNKINEDDAYFLGLFAAEGTSNPLSITTGDKELVDWINSYLEKKFNYFPTTRINKSGKNPVYIILIRSATKKLLGNLACCNSGNKFVPKEILFSNERIIRSFLAGYFDGDAEIGKLHLEVSTKSEILARDISYLLLKIGISSTKKEFYVKGRLYHSLFIVGEDRLKLNIFPFKIKKTNYIFRNTAYGYTGKIIEYFQKTYKETLGGNRGREEKVIGRKNNSKDIFYDYLIYKSFLKRSMNEKTLVKIKKVFKQGLERIEKAISLLNYIENKDKFLEVYHLLPFSFNSIAEEIGLKKSCVRNYVDRGLPKSGLKVMGIKEVLLKNLRARQQQLVSFINTLEILSVLNWDVITEIKEVEYNDYVYDFVVPEGHSFIGGNIPTILHNSQLGFALAVNVQLPVNIGGANGKAVWIDTESTFRPERIKQIAEAVGANPEKILKNIFVARAFSSDHQILLMDRIGEMIKNGEPIKLVVIDSLTAHFRAEFTGRGQLADRQQKLNRYLHNLIKLAEQYNLAIYVTNQVLANPAMMFGDPTIPVGGHILGHACLIGDSLIQLSDGSIKEIKSINQEEIISGNFKNMNLEKRKSDLVFANPDINEIYEIKTNNQIKCSALHRFFTINNFSITEKEAEELREGEFIAQIGRINFEGEEQKLPYINVKKIGKISQESCKKIKEKLIENNETRKEICEKIGIKPRQFRRVLNQRWPTSFNVIESLQKHFSGNLILEIMPFQTYKHKNLNMPEIMTSDLAQICGYFLGDGNLEERGLRFRDERFEVLSYYNELFKKSFNLQGNITKIKDKNCYNLNINSTEIKNLFKLIIPDIFDYIGKSKDDVVKGFIKGFVDAEGSVGKKIAIITVHQKNKQILRYLQLFLLRFGIKSTIKFDIGRKKICVLRVSCRDILDYLQIGFTAKDKQLILLKWADYYKRTYIKEMMPISRNEIWSLLKEANLFSSKFIKPRPKSYKWISRKELEKAFNALMSQKIKDRQIKQKIDFIFKILNSDIRFEKIREINVLENKNKELFYDFSVPEADNYTANGFIAHNSTFRLYLRRGKKDSRVAKMIDAPNLPENECVFFITKDGLRDEV